MQAGRRSHGVASRLVTVLVATGLLIAQLPNVTDAAFPGKNGRIAFIRADMSTGSCPKGSIWTMTAKGGGERKLTGGIDLGVIGGVAWSPDGKRIAFTVQTEIHEPLDVMGVLVMNADGSGKTGLVNVPVAKGWGCDPQGPTWSPNGKQIAVAGVGGIHVIDVAARTASLITGSAPDYYDQPAWSPDGKQIAVRVPARGAIGVIRATGGPATLITDAIAAFQPDWSPDGKRIIFQRDIGTGVIGYIDRCQGTVDAYRGSFNSVLDPAWSPDGKRMAYWGYFGPEPGSHWDIFSVVRDGGEPVNLTGTLYPIRESAPDWQPTGKPPRLRGCQTERLTGTVRGCPVAEPRCAEPQPLKGIVMAATGAGEEQATTGADGTYEMMLKKGEYQIAPVDGRYTPASRMVDVSADVTGVDFVAERMHRISGTVTACPADDPCADPQPAEGVIVRASGPADAEATTGPEGRYTLDVPTGTWAVSPDTGEAGSVPVSRSILVEQDAGAVDFRTCGSTVEKFVPCSSLAITITPPSASVFVEQTAEGPVVRDVLIGVTVRNRGDKPIHDVTLDPHLSPGFAPGTVDALPAPQLTDDMRPIPLRLKVAARPGDETRAIRIGTLEPGVARTETLTYEAHGDGELDLTALVGYTTTPGGRTLHTTGYGRLELDTRLVVASMTVDRWVPSPDAPDLIKAGTAYSVRVKLENRSYVRKLVVWDLVRASGNAEGGHWQPPDLPIEVTAWSDLGMETCGMPPLIALDPQQVVEADVVFRALASDPRSSTAITGRNAGGVSARLELVRPRAFLEVQGGEEQYEEVAPQRTLVVPDASAIRLSIDDGAADAPEWRGAESWVAAYAYYSLGADAAIISWTGSLLHGIFVDLPMLLVQGGLEIPGLVRKMTQYQVDLWEQVRKDPALLAIYSTGYGAIVAESFKLAPKVLTGGQQLLDVANQAAYAHFDQMATDWYAGDWMNAAYQFGSDVRTLELEIASLVAPCVLTRMPRVVEGARAARTAELTASAEVLASRVDQATDAARAMDVLQSARSVGLRAVAVGSKPIKLGTALSDPLLRQLFGLTDRQIAWLREWATTAARKGEPFLYTFRSRAAESLKWVDALLKPEELKLKTVNWIDAAFLGFKESDVGRLVVRQPPSLAELERRLRIEGISELLPNGQPNKLYKAITDRYQARVDEWLQEEPDAFVRAMQRWDEEGKVDFEYNWKENLVDPLAAPSETPTTAGFRLRPSETSRGPVPENATKVVRDGRTTWEVDGRPIEGEVTEWIVEVDVDGLGTWRSVTGDVDGVALTDVFGQNLSDARHVELASMLAAGEMQSPHLETLSWWDTARGFLWDGKTQYLKGVHAQLGPDGVFRLVELDLSPQAVQFLRAPDDYMAFFMGGYIVP